MIHCNPIQLPKSDFSLSTYCLKVLLTIKLHHSCNSQILQQVAQRFSTSHITSGTVCQSDGGVLTPQGFARPAFCWKNFLSMEMSLCDFPCFS